MIFTNKQDTVKDIWTKAKKHSGASIVGLPYDMENFQLCECCDQPILKEPISMWEHTKEFQVFGFGYPLWFSFLKYCIFLVVILIASRTGSQIYMAMKQNHHFCYGKYKKVHETSTKVESSHHPKAHQQSDNFWMIHLRHSDVNPQFRMYAHSSHPPATKQVSKSTEQGSKPTKQGSKPTKQGGNKVDKRWSDGKQCTSFMIYLSMIHGQPMYDDEFLKIIDFLIHLMALIGIRNMIQKEQQYYDERTCSLSDYSIMITDLPPVYGTKQMVINLFKEEFQKTYGGSSSEVKEIIYVMQSQEIQQYKDEIKELEKQALKAIEHDEIHELESIKAKIRSLDDQFDRQVKKLSADMRRDYIKCDKMIVIMNTQTDKGEVLEKYQEFLQNGNNFSKYFYHAANSNKQVQIKMKEAPEPNEIIWQHIDESDQKRKLLILRGWAFTFIFLVAITVIFYFILLAKTNIFVKAVEMQHHDPSSQAAKQFKVIATIIVFIALFGVILFNKFVMGKVLHIFVHMERHAYTDKQNHSFAIKYALGMFFTTALMTLAVEAITKQNFCTHQYGVIEQETIMFFVTAFFIPLVWLIHPYDLLKKFRFKGKQNKLIPQKQANHLSEHFAYDSGKRYAQIFEIMWFTFLYSELIPLGSFLILIGLVLYYWVDKYNFSRRSALKQGISGKLAILGLKSLDATLFLSYAGQILFDQIIRLQHSILPIILTVLGLAYLFIPISDIIWKINGQKFLLQSKTYDEARYSFKDHYITLHPVYKQTHKQQIVEYKKKVAEYYREEFKKIKMYGAGRGTFMKDVMQQNKYIRHANSLPEGNSDPNSIQNNKRAVTLTEKEGLEFHFV